jgi:hypothetical protein
MVVSMSGSPKPSAYPGPSAEVWAKRAEKEMKQQTERGKQFEELRSQVLSKKQAADKAKKDKKTEDERKFRALQAERAKKQADERSLRASVRNTSLNTIRKEHEKALREERMREHSRIQLGKMRIAEQGQSVLNEDVIETILDAGDVQFAQEQAKQAVIQRRLQEEADAEHEAQAKAAREAKAKEKEAKDRMAREERERQERENNYRIKKEMGERTRKQREADAAKEAAKKKLQAAERKKNDEYAAWLAKGDLLRDEMELMNERREGSAMHKGARFSGIPDTKVDGKGNQ